MLKAIAIAPRAVGHDEELSTVGHLDELRTRLIASLLERRVNHNHHGGDR